MNAVSGSEHGEVAGSFLLGLVTSLSYLNIVPEELNLDHIDPAQWYPYDKLIETIDVIQDVIPRSEIILFNAGINFMRIWYEDGPGKAMIHSGTDWLYANEGSGGYNSVVRGGSYDEIGWCILRSIDERAGIAVYENVMPLPPEFVRGVFYGGCMIFEDMEYVEVETVSEDYARNSRFKKFILTVRYKLRDEVVSRSLDARLKDARLEDVRHDAAVSLSPAEIETLIWRTKGMQVKIALEKEYHEAIGALLAGSIDAVRKTARELELRNTEIEHLANYDALTGLPTRRMALGRLETIDERRAGGRNAVLFIDLDGFKACNDRFGHDAGDHVLKTVSERLLKCIRDDDMAARLGGDEFLVVASDVTKPELIAMASKILAAIAQPIHYDLNRIDIGSSIGIAFAGDLTRPDVLLKKADQAMYTVKTTGKNNFAFFGSDPEPRPAALAQAAAA